MPHRALLLFAVLLVACASLACEEVELREDRRALLAFDRDFAQKVEQQGFRVLEDFYDEDAVYMPSFAPTIEGREKILDAYRPYYDSSAIKLAWVPTRAEVARSRDLGWTIGTYTVTRTDDKGNTTLRHGRYVTVWKKQRDGRWKAVLDAGTPDEKPAPPAGATQGGS
jgi:ketosteroid isomerase-like protein